MKRKTKNALIVAAAVLLTAGAVGGIAYMTKGFTTVDPVVDLTKQGTRVYALEKTVAPLTHIATWDIPDDKQETISGGNFSASFQLDVAEKFVANVAGTISTIENLGYFSASQGELIAAQESASDVLNVGILFSQGYNIHEWTSSSAENTKLKAFDTLRINFDLAEKALLVSSSEFAEEANDPLIKKFAKVENITSLHSYIDIDMSEIGEDGYVNNITYQIVGLSGNVIPDLEIKSVELVNKACAYDFVSYTEV